MLVIGELGRKGLPRAIPAGELHLMLGSSEEFCSWDAAYAAVNDSATGWPYLFSHPLTATETQFSVQ